MIHHDKSHEAPAEWTRLGVSLAALALSLGTTAARAQDLSPKAPDGDTTRLVPTTRSADDIREIARAESLGEMFQRVDELIARTSTREEQAMRLSVLQGELESSSMDSLQSRKIVQVLGRLADAQWEDATILLTACFLHTTNQEIEHQIIDVLAHDLGAVRRWLVALKKDYAEMPAEAREYEQSKAGALLVTRKEIEHVRTVVLPGLHVQMKGAQDELDEERTKRAEMERELRDQLAQSEALKQQAQAQLARQQRLCYSLTFEVTTSDIEDAGTDAQIFLILKWEGGSRKVELYEQGDDENEQGQTSRFEAKLDAPIPADLTSVELSHDDEGIQPGWHVSRCKLIMNTTAQGPVVAVDRALNRWLASDEPEGLTARLK